MDQFRTSQGFPSVNYLLYGAASLALVLVCAFWFSQPSAERINIDERRGNHRLEVLKKLRADEEEKLSSLVWVKKEDGVARVPIEVAMKLAVKELSAKGKKPSAIKAEAPLVIPPPADPDYLPPSAAPSGAKIVQFPKLSKGSAESGPKQ